MVIGLNDEMCVLFCHLSLLPQGVSRGDFGSGALSASPLDFSGKPDSAASDDRRKDIIPDTLQIATSRRDMTPTFTRIGA